MTIILVKTIKCVTIGIDDTTTPFCFPAFVGTIQMHPKLKAAVGWILSLDPMDAIRPIMRGYSAVHDISMTVVDVYGKLLDEALNVMQEFIRRPEVQAVIMWMEDIIAKVCRRLVGEVCIVVPRLMCPLRSIDAPSFCTIVCSLLMSYARNGLTFTMVSCSSSSCLASVDMMERPCSSNSFLCAIPQQSLFEWASLDTLVVF